MPSQDVIDLIRASKSWLDFFGRACVYCLASPDQLSRLADSFRIESGPPDSLVNLHHIATKGITELLLEGQLSRLTVQFDSSRSRLLNLLGNLAGADTLRTVVVLHGAICAVDAHFEQRDFEVLLGFRAGTFVVPRCPSPVAAAIEDAGAGIPIPATLIPYRLRLLLRDVARVRNLHPILPEYTAILDGTGLKTINNTKWRRIQASLVNRPLRVAVVQFLNRLSQLDIVDSVPNQFIIRAWTPSASGPLLELLQSVILELDKLEINLAVLPELVVPSGALKDIVRWIEGGDLFSRSPLLIALGSHHSESPVGWVNTSPLFWIGQEHGRTVCEEIMSQGKQNPYSYQTGPVEKIEGIRPRSGKTYLVNTPFGRVGLVICRDLIADDQFSLISKAFAVDWLLVPALTSETASFARKMRELGHWNISAALANSCSVMHGFHVSSEEFNRVSRIYLPYKEHEPAERWQKCPREECPQFSAFIHFADLHDLKNRQTKPILAFSDSTASPDEDSASTAGS